MKTIVNHKRYFFSDFTERNYKRLLKIAKKRFDFEFFGTKSKKPHILLRHDIDVSVHRAVALAEIEADLGIRATYFLRLHGEYYNIFEKQIHKRIERIVSRGHELGLHFDTDFFDNIPNKTSLARHLETDSKIIEKAFLKRVNVFSFHNPEVWNVLRFTDDRIAGMINVYGNKTKANYRYCSDSNGYWRFERLENLLRNPEVVRLHVLIHPEWWQKKALSPQQRIIRAINGRADSVKANYIATLRKMGRKDVA